MRPDSNPTPWARMALSGAATCIPLIIGFATGQLMLSVYGALVGYLMALCDDQGPVRHRLWTITFTFLLLVSGFSLGRMLPGTSPWFYIIFTSLVYWLGILAGEGAELERALLFTTISLLSAHSSQTIPSAAIPLLFIYACIGYASNIIGVALHAAIGNKSPEPVIGFVPSFFKTFELRRKNRIHAVCYSLSALLSVWFTGHFNIERGYWVIITVLLVMKPDKNPTFYRAIQRFIGTILAVLCVDAIMWIFRDQRLLVLLVIFCAIGIPWAIKKNYWIVSFLATVMVVLILELSTAGRPNLHTPFVRLIATLIGCTIGVLGLFCSRITDSVLCPNRKSTPANDPATPS